MPHPDRPSGPTPGARRPAVRARPRADKPRAGSWTGRANAPGASRRARRVELRVSRGFILPALEITVLDSTIRIKRLRFRLKWVLNRITFTGRQSRSDPEQHTLT